jgi:hypothetical protein
MRLMIAESARFPDLMSKVATIIFTRFTGNLAALFRQLAENGLIPKGDHDQSAVLFADLLMGNRTVMIYFGWVSAAPTAKDIEVKIDLFIKGRFGGLPVGTRAKSARKLAAKTVKPAAKPADAPAKSAKPTKAPVRTPKPAPTAVKPATRNRRRLPRRSPKKPPLRQKPASRPPSASPDSFDDYTGIANCRLPAPSHAYCRRPAR